MPLHHIRPWVLFNALEAEGPARCVSVRLAKRRGFQIGVESNDVDFSRQDHSTTYLETMVLLCAAKLVSADYICEFGTHLGSTTLNLAINLHDKEEGWVYTFDLMPTERFKEWTSFRTLVDPPRIKAYQGDTSKINFDFLKELFQLVWVDGCANRSFDTDTAFELLDTSRLGCIAWHDYGRPEVTNTTALIAKLSESGLTLYHIEETSVVLYFNRAGVLPC